MPDKYKVMSQSQSENITAVWLVPNHSAVVRDTRWLRTTL